MEGKGGVYVFLEEVTIVDCAIVAFKCYDVDGNGSISRYVFVFRFLQEFLAHFRVWAFFDFSVVVLTRVCVAQGRAVQHAPVHKQVHRSPDGEHPA